MRERERAEGIRPAVEPASGRAAGRCVEGAESRSEQATVMIRAMRTLRTLHLYLGSLFAPALIALSISGAWQVYRWNDAKKDGSYTPSPVVRLFSDIHKDQVLPGGRHGQNPAMQWFTLGASIGLTLTTLLGIVMAYRMSRRPVVVTLLLLTGILLPTFLLSSCAKPAGAKPIDGKKEASKRAPAPTPVPLPAWTPGLGELMSLQQMRHVKLWFAGEAGNWKLARYELDELKEGFDDVVRLHPTHKDSPVPVSEVVPRIMALPLADLGKIVEARDRARFGKAYDALTAACNSCHEATNFGFNVVRRPAVNPYPNQSFAAPGP